MRWIDDMGSAAMKFAFKSALVAACALALAGCGGGSLSAGNPRLDCDVTPSSSLPGFSCQTLAEEESPSPAARARIAQGDARVGSLTQSSNLATITIAGMPMTMSADHIQAIVIGDRVRIFNDRNDDGLLGTDEWAVTLDTYEVVEEGFTLTVVGDVAPSGSGFVAAAGTGLEFLGTYVIFGVWRRSADDFGFFADGTQPGTIPISGDALYEGEAYMYSHPSGQSDFGTFAAIPITVSVRFTSLGPVFAHAPQAIDSLFMLTGGTWDPVSMALVGGEIECAPGISACSTAGADSSWSIQFIDLQLLGGAPDLLVGTFAVTGIRISEVLRDLYGFFGGENAALGAQVLLRSINKLKPDQIRQAPAQLAEAGIYDSDFFARADRHARVAAVRAAGSSRDGSKPNELGVTYTSFGTHFATGFWSDEVAFGAFADNSGIPVGQQLPVSGSAVYSGTAGGVYASSSSDGTFTGTAEFTAEFGADAPSIRGAIDYDFAGAAGRLQLDNAQWDSSAARFDNGSIGCVAGCTGLDESSWGGEFMSLDPVAQGARVPEAFVGTFGAAGLQMDGQQFDALGVFATATE